MLIPLNFFTTLFALFLNRSSINIFLLYLTMVSAPKVPNKDKSQTFECDSLLFQIHELRLMHNII